MLLALQGEFEGEALDAVHSHAGHHRLLANDLARRVLEQPAAYLAVFALGVLAHDDEIDRAGLGQRRGDARHQPHGPKAHVLVELAAKLHQRAPKRDVVGHLLRPPDRAEEDGVVGLQRLAPVRRHHAPVLLIIIHAGEIEAVHLEIEPELGRGGVEHPQPLGNDLLANPVAGD